MGCGGVMGDCMMGEELRVVLTIVLMAMSDIV
jgi:hypothetical protein